MKSLKLLLRFMVIGGLILLLLVPLLMIRGLIHERESYRSEAVRRVAQNTAGPQQFTGPIKVVPWTDTQVVAVTDENGGVVQRIERKQGQVLLTPTMLDIDGRLDPERLKSGLFQVPVYTWRAKLKADFEGQLPAATQGVARVYGTPYIVLGISDVRGLVGTPAFRLDGRAMRIEPGTRDLKWLDGVHVALPEITGNRVAGGKVDIDITLKGTQSLSVAPIGNDNKLAIASSWESPKFDGYSPSSDLDGPGFKASWNVSSLSSNLPAKLQMQSQAQQSSGRPSGTDFPGKGDADMVKVSLIDPVDIYTQADRASKYGILFVVLTFVGFALFELIKRLPIHPLQYLLVGLALAIFFLLLLSLSEHIPFWQAYLVSAVACIGLQFFYLSGVLRSWLRASGFAVMLTALYGVLYSLLASEDNALLMGSLLLFGILAAIMWITRKVDWYELGSSLR